MASVILIEKSKLPFLLNGRVITVDSKRGAFHKGRTYAVGVSRGKTLCRVEILKITPSGDSYELQLRRAHDEKQIYLAASPGAIRADYTENPARAAREADGSPIAAVAGGAEASWLKKVAQVAAERDDLIRRER